MASAEKAREAAETFLDEYLKGEFREYFGPIATGPTNNIKDMGWYQKLMSVYRANGKPTMPDKTMAEDDWSLKIGLMKRLPDNTGLPVKYESVDVYYYAAGKIRYH